MNWSRALVTGASSGIGRAMAVELAARGTDLVVVARSGGALEALATELGDRDGVDVEVLSADLTDREQLAAVEARVADLEQPVDLLVNNAGFGTFGRFDELDVDREEAEIALNVTALVRLTHAAARTMRARGAGAILNVSSMTGFQPIPNNATYAATKAFVTSFTQAVAEELRGSGVRVTVLCPGFTETAFQDTAEVDASMLPGVAWMPPDRVARAGLAAIARGRTVAVPGALNRVTATMQRVLPTSILRRATGVVLDRFAR